MPDARCPARADALRGPMLDARCPAAPHLSLEMLYISLFVETRRIIRLVFRVFHWSVLHVV